MKKKFAYLAIFFTLYSIFVLALMPANWVVSLVKLPSNVTLSGVEGTVWQTQVAQVRVDDVDISQVESSLSLMSIIMLDPKFDIRFGDPLLNGPEGRFMISGLMDKLVIESAQVNVAANTVAKKLNLAIDIVAHEQVQLTVDRFVMGAPICQEMQGQLLWNNAAVTAFEEKVRFGKLSANLSCESGNLIGEVNPANNLGLSFRAELTQRGRLVGNGYLTPGAKFPEQLKALLSFLGQADNQGRYRLKL